MGTRLEEEEEGQGKQEDEDERDGVDEHDVDLIPESRQIAGAAKVASGLRALRHGCSTPDLAATAATTAATAAATDFCAGQIARRHRSGTSGLASFLPHHARRWRGLQHRKR